MAKKRALSLLRFPNIDKYGRKTSLLPSLEYTAAGDLGSETENQMNHCANNDATQEMDVVNGEEVNTDIGVVTKPSIRKYTVTEFTRDYVDDQCFSLNLSYLPGTPHTAGKISRFTLFDVILTITTALLHTYRAEFHISNVTCNSTRFLHSSFHVFLFPLLSHTYIPSNHNISHTQVPLFETRCRVVPSPRGPVSKPFSYGQLSLKTKE